jgi:hypothetical protein
MRSLLPKFDGNAIELGSLPDLTFGGAIGGLTRNQVEGFLGEHITMLPVGYAPSRSTNGLSLTFATLRGHSYSLEASTNLANWKTVMPFVATNSVSAMMDTQSGSKRFYRLRDNTGFLAFTGVVLDQNTGLPISGAQVQSVWDGTTTLTDFYGQFYLLTSLRTYSWGAYDELKFTASGHVTFDNYYYGNGLASGLQIYLSLPPSNDNFSSRTILAGTNLSVTGSNVGASQESGEPNPTGNAAGQSVWWSWTAPTNGIVSIDATASSFYPLIGVYTGSSLLSLVSATNGGGNINFPVTAGISYQLALDGNVYYYPSSGNISFNLNFTPTPPNDNFVNRFTLTGTNVTVSGSNVGATLEAGEPTHQVLFTATQSVWWTWQAPKTGQVTISTVGSSFRTTLEIYTGTSISSLTRVAGAEDTPTFSQVPTVNLSVTAGTFYQIAVTGIGASGTISLSVNEP